MRNGLEEFLRDTACYEFSDEYLENYGRVSPYIFRTPTPFTAEQLSAVGENGAKIVSDRASSAPVHIVGVGSRGLPLATVITTELRAAFNIPAYLSIAGKDGSTEHLASIPDCYTVLVDNAIVSGRTMEAVLGKLRADAFTIDLILYLFDREEIDSSGTDPALRIADEFRCDISSIFSLRDIIAETGSQEQRAVLLKYAQEFGNESIRDHLEIRRREGSG